MDDSSSSANQSSIILGDKWATHRCNVNELIGEDRLSERVLRKYNDILHISCSEF